MGWVENEQEMSDHISEEYAERIRHRPMIRPANGRRTADPDRAEYETRGVFEWQSKRVDLLKGQDRSRTPPAAFHLTREPVASFDKRDLSHHLKEGDLLIMVDQGGLVFEVLDPMPDGQSRILCRLTQQGAHIT